MAWEQPHTDQELLSHPPTRAQEMMQAAISRSRLLQAVQATMPRSVSPEDYVSRVDLSDYTKNVEFFAEQARQHGAQLLFIDYRLYADYANYSQVLSEISKKYPHVHYFYVLDAVTAAFNAPRTPDEILVARRQNCPTLGKKKCYAKIHACGFTPSFIPNT